MPRPPKPVGTTADKILAVRLTTADHALMGEVVKRHQADMLKAGIAGTTNPASLVRTLLLREAERLGVTTTTSAPAEPAEPTKPPTKAPQSKKKPPARRGK